MMMMLVCNIELLQLQKPRAEQGLRIDPKLWWIIAIKWGDAGERGYFGSAVN